MTAKEVLTKNIVYERLTSETPDFWKRIRFYAQVGTVLVSILGSIAVPLSAPLWVGITIGALDALCVSTIALSSVTTTNEKISEKEAKPSWLERNINKIINSLSKNKAV